METGNGTILVEVDDGFLVAQLLLALGGVHDEGNVAYLIAVDGAQHVLHHIFLTAEVLVGPELGDVGYSLGQHVLRQEADVGCILFLAAVDFVEQPGDGTLHLVLHGLVADTIADGELDYTIGRGVDAQSQ